jgi:hypothetical protein
VQHCQSTPRIIIAVGVKPSALTVHNHDQYRPDPSVTTSPMTRPALRGVEASFSCPDAQDRQDSGMVVSVAVHCIIVQHLHRHIGIVHQLVLQQISFVSHR